MVQPRLHLVFIPIVIPTWNLADVVDVPSTRTPAAQPNPHPQPTREHKKAPLEVSPGRSRKWTSELASELATHSAHTAWGGTGVSPAPAGARTTQTHGHGAVRQDDHSFSSMYPVVFSQAACSSSVVSCRLFSLSRKARRSLLFGLPEGAVIWATTI